MRPIFLLTLIALAALAQPMVKELDIAADRQWTDTGIDLGAGDTLRITATGTVQYTNSKPAGPEGMARGWMDMIRNLPVVDSGRGALIGRIGERDASRAFLIGPRRESNAPVAGRLFLGINQASNEKAQGSFHVRIEHVPAPAASAPAKVDPASITKLSQQTLDSIPRRVSDRDGTVGDRTNFVIVGSEDQVRAGLQAAGWVGVDRATKDAVIRGVLASLSKQAYVTMPMSELLLFDRPQDYGYAQGDPVRVVASRHHFRIWKAPFELDGRTVWAGAGTHDTGFDRDQRNGKITHRIDSDVDKERDYIGRSLQETGMVAHTEYMTPRDPIRQAKTAHGQAFRSDGRTLIIYLTPDRLNLSRSFGDYFCSVLRQNNPDTGEWGECAQYMDTPGKADLALGPLKSPYRVLVVPGIFSSCAADAPAFDVGRQVLKEKYGVTAELFGVPNDSSEDNARKIAAYLREQSKTDKSKFIVLGYSKGAPDLQVALAQEEGVPALVAAFITVAGASGGSPIADAMPAIVDRWLSQFKMGKCEGDIATGFKSLRRDVRQKFLASYPNPLVPTYSLVALSDKTNTSKALLRGWELMAVFDRLHDGQLTKQDAIVPGARYLGAARGDHLAVALPLDKVADGALRAAMDKARYPRAALLEALVRFVVADLGQPK